MVKFITALVAATTAALATSAMATSKIDANIMAEMVIDPSAASAPTNNVPGANPGATANTNYQGNPGGKPSAEQHRALKSQRMAERRTRVKAAIANLPNEPDSKLQRMSEEELERAMKASDLAAQKHGKDMGAQKAGLKLGLERERGSRLNGGNNGGVRV
eukprot:CAMPEP_0202017818 /NCGR_PEP_ID=MMETSP0905-20130828/38005_1 /ASSEMBLY_ACC=CAM_ASM_000554 /TAXON_ID=420261 /ORGANISM="Thalassiosira antarctica, Strain CCMP982" /LENGTH=159 /DNA_ID=CAMNT_0048578593 /DNA_START=148 /DNA_END=623 /DNA_ORIENTATION=-